MKNLNKQTVAQVITSVAMDYITRGELIDCYNIICDTYGLTTKQIDEIIDKYNNVLDELVDWLVGLRMDCKMVWQNLVLMWQKPGFDVMKRGTNQIVKNS
jgi:hypothetical protein